MDRDVQKYLDEVLTCMREAQVAFPLEAVVNIYHHMGRQEIYKTGAMFMNVVNRDYCKSYVVMLAGQHYPEHYHKIKKESFYILSGNLMVQVEDQITCMQPGQILHVDEGQVHSFWTETGVVFEELSTMYVPNDSVYMDESIRNSTYEDRRTTIDNAQWKEIRKGWIK